MAVVYVPPDQRQQLIGGGIGNLAGMFLGMWLKHHMDQAAIQRVNDVMGQGGQSAQQPQGKVTGNVQSSSNAPSDQGQQQPNIDLTTGQEQPPDTAALTAAAGNNKIAQQYAQGLVKNFELKRQQKADVLAGKREALSERREARVEASSAATRDIAQKRLDIEQRRFDAERELDPLKKQNILSEIKSRQLEIAQKQHDLDVGTAVEKAPTGTGALDALPEGERMIVQGMIKGQIQPPSSFALARPAWQNRLAAAEKATGGNFDETLWVQRHKTRTDYSPGGAVGKSIQAGNNAIPHLELWVKAHEELANGNTRGYNQILQTIKQMTVGNPELAGVTNVRDILSEELRKFFAGSGGGSLAEFQEWQKNLAQKQTPSEAIATSKSIMGLLGAQYSNYSDQWNRTMGENVNQFQFMTPAAQKAWQNLGGSTSVSPASAGSGKYRSIEDLQSAVKNKDITPSQARDIAIKQGLAQ